MAILNFIPPPDPEQRYAGKVLPQDAAPIYTPPTDPNVFYANHLLPQDKVQQPKFIVDPKNDPGLIQIGNVYLPRDTVILINGKKVLAESYILDGVSVYEHILRKPYEIEFDVVIREASAIPGSNFDPFVASTSTDFPQQQLNYVWFTVWETNTVQKVNNTYLNGIGIQEIIIESVNPMTVRGSKNIPLKIKAYENQPGQTIIIN